VETIDAYLERLASNAPVPGGGSAAALVAGTAAALVAMVGRILKSPLDEIVATADALRAQLSEGQRRDESAFAAVVTAQALPKHNEAEKAMRRRELEAALALAAEEPLRAATLELEVLKLTVRLVEFSSAALASDVGCAAEFAHAALAASAYNVRVNHRYMHDLEKIAAQEERLRSLEAEAQSALAGVRAAVAQRLRRER
jgi:formiminotetrahydrofolate cyclodeaminase